MNILATTSDQVLLAALYTVHWMYPSVPIVAVVEAYQNFQRETGLIVYGSARQQTDALIEQDVRVDARNLTERVLVSWNDKDTISIGVMGIPVARALYLVSPFDRIPDFLRGALARRARL